jgi:hypothetical protein
MTLYEKQLPIRPNPLMPMRHDRLGCGDLVMVDSGCVEGKVRCMDKKIHQRER